MTTRTNNLAMTVVVRFLAGAVVLLALLALGVLTASAAVKSSQTIVDEPLRLSSATVPVAVT